MKTCSRCKVEKELSEFYLIRARNDAPMAHCKVCELARSKAWREGSDVYADRKSGYTRKHRTKAQLFVWNYLLAHPCVDCGEDDPVVLEFDHVRGDKSREISAMVNACFGLKAIAAEIEKCDVRCANCHRRQTARRGGWYSLIQEALKE